MQKNKSLRLENITDVLFVEVLTVIIEDLKYVEDALEKWHIVGIFPV